jgi:hypothetical protein
LKLAAEKVRCGLGFFNFFSVPVSLFHSVSSILLIFSFLSFSAGRERKPNWA